MVVNGACKHKDMAHFNAELEKYGSKDVCMEYMEESLALTAIQGPKAAEATQTIMPSGIDLTSVDFMQGKIRGWRRRGELRNILTTHDN